MLVRSILAAVVVSAIAPSIVRGGPRAVVLAESGDIVSDGAKLWLLDPPSISANGTIAFSARVFMPNGTLPRVLIVIYPDGSRSSVLDGDPASGLDGTTWEAVPLASYPIVNNAGLITFAVRLHGNGLPADGIGAYLVGLPDALRVRFRRDSSAEGIPAGWRLRFGGTTSFEVRYGLAGFAVSRGTAVSPDELSTLSVLVVEDGEVPRVVVRSSDTAPGLPAGVPIGPLLDHKFNNHGVSAIAANTGIWLRDESGLQLVAARNGAATFAGPDAVFTSGFDRCGLNDAGQVVFPAAVSGRGDVIVAGVPGELREVVQVASLEFPSGQAFQSVFGDPVINRSGTIAFALNNGRSDTYSPAAIFVSKGTALTRIAAFGQQAPGFPVGCVFGDLSFVCIHMNALDQIVFSAEIEFPMSLESAYTLWGWTPGVGLTLLVSGDRPLETVSGRQILTPAAIHHATGDNFSAASGGEDGTPRMLADNGQVVFSVFSNPSEVYLVAMTLPGAGDTNGDGVVDVADLSLVLGSYGQAVEMGAPGDFNADGMVNAADLSVLLSAFGT